MELSILRARATKARANYHKSGHYDAENPIDEFAKYCGNNGIVLYAFCVWGHYHMEFWDRLVLNGSQREESVASSGPNSNCHDIAAHVPPCQSTKTGLNFGKSLTRKAISKTLSIALIVGHSTQFSLNKEPLAIPNSNQTSKYEPPIRYLNAPASLVTGATGYLCLLYVVGQKSLNL
jgi:hypothetical protein